MGYLGQELLTLRSYTYVTWAMRLWYRTLHMDSASFVIVLNIVTA